MKNFPVFVFPVSLEFYVNARHTYKQLLTVYNPYDFPVNFKVLCTSPNKYTVIDPEGVIAAQSCIDIVVRYTQPAPAAAAHGHAHAGAVDKFRITMYDRNTQQALGKRDIPTKLLEGEPAGVGVAESLAAAAIGDSFHPLTRRDTPGPARTDEHSGIGGVHERAACSHPAHYSREQQPVNVVAVAVSICCIAALLLPTQPEPITGSQWPDWLHIGANLKLVFSFVLGLVSMLVLRP